MAKAPWVHDLIAKEVAGVNAHLPQYETIKRFALLDQDFSFEKGELTYTMKLKRRVIDDRYREIIERLYPKRKTGNRFRPIRGKQIDPFGGRISAEMFR